LTADEVARSSDGEPAPSASDVVDLLTRRGLTVATAESLTGGMVASSIADVPGASAVLQGGVVAYQVSVKERVLGVDADLLAGAGAVDPRVAAAMADGVRELLAADIGVATTGVAGPGVHEGKPAGTVFTALSTVAGTRTFAHRFPGGRGAVRNATLDAVLSELAVHLGGLSRGTNSVQG
jgi:nicotinamide-nucleotide amidase